MPIKEKWKVELVPLPDGNPSIPPPNFGRLKLDNLGLQWIEVKTKVKDNPPVPKIEYNAVKTDIEEAEESETSIVSGSEPEREQSDSDSDQSLSEPPKSKKKHKSKKIAALSTKYKRLRKGATIIDSSSSSESEADTDYETTDSSASSPDDEEDEDDESDDDFEIIEDDESEDDDDKISRSSKPRIRLEKPRRTRKSDDDDDSPPDLKEYLAKWYILKRKFPHKADEMPTFTEQDSAVVVKKEWERWARILGIEAFVEDNTGYAKLGFVVMELTTVYYFGINEFKGFTKAQLKPNAMQKYERLLLEMGEERTTAQAMATPKWPAWIRLVVAMLVAAVAFWAESMIAKVGGDFIGNIFKGRGTNTSGQKDTSSALGGDGGSRGSPPHPANFQPQRNPNPPPQRVIRPPNINLGART